MHKIAVTGATSMIGVALIKECIKNNVGVLAIVREKSNRLDRIPDSDLIRLYECDMDKLGTFFIDEQYDVFYHFAWDYTSKQDRNNPVLQQKNINYTLDAVKLANKLGCRKFIGAGSQAEYGRVNDVITPLTPVSPLTAYGVAKYAAGRLSELLCREYGMTHIWGRIFSVYGRNDNEGTMLNYAVDQFLNGEYAKFSAATQMWDYLHEDDAGRIFYLLGEKVRENKTYRIASGNARQLKEFILELSELFGNKASCEFAENVNDGNLIELNVDISDLIADIEYVPQIVFKEGVKDMAEYRTKVRKL